MSHSVTSILVIVTPHTHIQILEEYQLIALAGADCVFLSDGDVYALFARVEIIITESF